MTRLLPRFRIGAGWLYVLAGLGLCAAGILVPARADLDDLLRQRDRLAAEKAIADERVEAYESFLHLLEADDPALIRRLAAAQLNLVPEGETPMLMAASRTATVTDWIDGNVRAEPTAAAAMPRDTLLSRLVGGPGRLWVLAAGVVVVFVGLLLDDSRSPARRRPAPALPHWPVAAAARRPGSTATAACGDPELNPWYDE